ncbi:MAG: hypothetical protein Hyperionvirus3_14 [Hyperionvirus sp.]|uniref:Leucine-rich repeat protein n=1 Tax=Hyperionvirus sp. TaxID=2487770 RepID=A0A3G5A6R2_9VIRU|nr:MAG: hypothetical protein Hyperionvirus3_14 [Hyperionvirus sp.]
MADFYAIPLLVLLDYLELRDISSLRINKYLSNQIFNNVRLTADISDSSQAAIYCTLLKNVKFKVRVYIDSSVSKDMLSRAISIKLHSNSKMDDRILQCSNMKELHIIGGPCLPPTTLQALTQLEILHLFDAKKYYTDTINKLTNLKKLLCSHTTSRIINFQNNTLSNLTNLESLEMRFCDFLTDGVFDKMVKLNNLKIQTNENLTSTSISHLTGLTSLELTYTTKITNDVFKYLTNLQVLHIETNKHITHENLEHLTSLHSLTLIGNNSIKNLKSIKNLTHLEIQNCVYDWSFITEEMVIDLTNLKSLYLGESEITDNCLNKLTNLTRLCLSSSHEEQDNELITDFGIIPLTNLRYLELRDAVGISDKALIKLTNLTELDIMDDQFASSIKFKNEQLVLKSLKTLRLHKGRINFFWDKNFLVRTPSITSLDLSGEINIGPKLLGKLHNIRILSLRIKNKYDLSPKILGQMNLSQLIINQWSTAETKYVREDYNFMIKNGVKIVITPSKIIHQCQPMHFDFC